MINTYESLKDLINEQLNSNQYGCVFNTTLFDSKQISNEIEIDNDDGYGKTTKKVTPAHIEDITGNYINIPDTNVIQGQMGVTFDIFTKEYTSLDTPTKQELYKSVSYRNTMLSIDEMRKNLLAKSFPLGTSGHYFCGDESDAEVVTSTAFQVNTIYMKLDIKNTNAESLFKTEIDANNYISITKGAGGILLAVVVSSNSTFITVPYTIGENEIYAYYNSNNEWVLTVGENTNSSSFIFTQNSFDTFNINPSNDYNGVLYQLSLDDSLITPKNIEDGLESKFATFQVSLSDSTSRYEFNQNGEATLTTNTVTNSILWGSNGVATFGFETPVPISNLRYQDDGYPRQLYGLAINVLISFDVIFGNEYEYFLEGEQVYPVDRQTTYASEVDSEQYIEDYFTTGVILSNGKDNTQTFFVKPSALLVDISKHLTSNTIEQNRNFTLVVQYPFYRETYSVLIDTGGINSNINQLSTISVTYKQRDTNIT